MKNSEINNLESGWMREVESVRILGERIGYGNMMDIASALWAIYLKENHGVDSGAFVPTIPAFMKKREAVKAVAQRANKISIILKYRGTQK